MSALPCDLKALKTTTHALIDACGGSTACSVLLDGKSGSLIRSYGNINVVDRFMPLDDVMVLERHAQQPLVSAWLVERHKSDPDRCRRAISLEDLARMAKENSDAMNALVEALADGKLDAGDRMRLARELRDVITLHVELLDAVEMAE